MYSFLDVLEVLLLLYIKSGCVLHICNERIRLRGKVKFEFRRGKKPESWILRTVREKKRDITADETPQSKLCEGHVPVDGQLYIIPCDIHV